MYTPTETRLCVRIEAVDNQIRRLHANSADLTLWVANPYRTVPDPSKRDHPDGNVHDTAADIEALHVPASDLYRLWAMVKLAV